MTLSHLLSIIAAILGFSGAIFLSYGILATTPPVMAKLSQACWDRNPEVVKNVCGTKADYFCGVTLIVIAFALQIVGLIFAQDGCQVFHEYWTGVIIGIILCLCVIAIFLGLNKSKRNFYQKQVMAVLDAKK